MTNKKNPKIYLRNKIDLFNKKCEKFIYIHILKCVYK